MARWRVVQKAEDAVQGRFGGAHRGRRVGGVNGREAQEVLVVASAYGRTTLRPVQPSSAAASRSRALLRL
jgi:hypothetical protein